MLKITIILVAAAVLCIAGYIFSATRRTKKAKSAFRRLTGVGSFVFVIAAAVTFVIYCRSNNIKLFNNIKQYDPVVSYTEALAKNGKDAAYAGLPDGIYSFNNDIYFKNGSGDMFKIGTQTQTAEDGTETQKTVTEVVSNGAAFVGGKNTLRAMINNDGELILDGYLLYSQFDGKLIEYKNKVIAKDVVYCTLTDNSLLYITTDGDMYALGFNEYGQLGDTTTKNKATPTYVLPKLKSASVSETHSMTVDKYGTLYAVGDNSYSQLGNKTAVSSTDPVTIMQGVKDVRVGNYYSIVLTINGDLLTAGSNEKGQLGNGGEAFKAELIPILSGIDKIDINGDTCAALTYAGELYVWGDNTGAKAGTAPDKTVLPSPVKISQNVLDFTLTNTGVAIINNDRDILRSDATGAFMPVITFGAQIPDIYKSDAELVTETAPDAA